MAEEILLTKTIVCPACEQRVPLTQVNPRAYTVASRESDRHVTRYQWLREVPDGIVPHHYALWQCPECLFTEFADTVSAEKPGEQEAARELFGDLSLEKKMVLDSLRELVPRTGMTQVGAIGIHWAALLINSLPISRSQVDHGRRGRIALRLGWLFRELDGAAPPAPPVPEGQVMADLAEATERLDRLVKDAEGVLGEIQAKGRLRGRELRLPEHSEANPYLALGELIEVRLKTLKAEVATLQMAVLHDQQGRMEPACPETEAVLGADMAQVVQSVLPFWPDLPRTERQCLLLCLEALEYSYQHETGPGSEEQSVAQVNLILDLLVRLGLLERALDWTSQISKFAADTAADLQQRISKGKASRTMRPHDEAMVNRKIAALDQARQQAGESRREILDLMLARDRPRIDAVLKDTSALPTEMRLEALTEIGIHSGVQAMLSRELAARPGKPREEPGRFKKWLNS